MKFYPNKILYHVYITWRRGIAPEWHSFKTREEVREYVRDYEDTVADVFVFYGRNRLGEIIREDNNDTCGARRD